MALGISIALDDHAYYFHWYDCLFQKKEMDLENTWKKLCRESSDPTANEVSES